MGKRKSTDADSDLYGEKYADEQPSEEGTDPHEDPPLDGPLADQTSTPDGTPPPEGDPELEPPPSPDELRAAPPVESEEDREDWGDSLPSFDELRDATTLEVRTKDPRSAGIYVGGERVTREPREVSVQTILSRTEGHLRAFLTEPAVQVRVKK